MQNKDSNIFFSESAQGWVLEVFTGYNPHDPYGSDWTRAGCFSSRQAAAEHYRANYS